MKRIWLISGLGLLATGAAWYFFIHKPTQDRDYDVTDDPEEAPNGSSPKSDWLPVDYPMKMGMAGYEVMVVQKHANVTKRKVLEDAGMLMKVDGYWGKNTEKALNKARYSTRISEMEYQKMFNYLQSKGELPVQK